MKSAFLIATDLKPAGSAWAEAARQVESLADPCARILGFEPRIDLVSLADLGSPPRDADEVFVIPTCLDFSVWEREALGQTLAEWRRSAQGLEIHADTVDLGHPLLIDCFADLVSSALAGSPISPQRVGLLLAASGHGDSASRAQSYRLMRLLWEQLGVAAGKIGFIRNAQPFLGHAVNECLREPLQWLIVPQMQWAAEHFDYARTILENHKRANPESAAWRLVSPPGAHPALSAWLTQRMVELWRDKRRRNAARAPSIRRLEAATHPVILAGSTADPIDGIAAEIRSPAAIRELLGAVLPPSDRYFVKVTWHGYAPGTFTDPAGLDLLLSALPGRAVILEGHTSSRNLGGADFDWETDAQCHRTWLAQQDSEYLRRTGLADVLSSHGAQYINVTEAFWDDRCAPANEVLDFLKDAGVTLRHEELASFVPEAAWWHRGATFLSFAKFKGPTRLGISNLFGLLPPPLRAAWHGPNITWFAQVCCDLARLYGAMFRTFGIVEALYTAVRWDRGGLYRSRWGNYDILANRGILTLSQELPAADILASRLQGQDVTRSAFFDVVRQELGWPRAAVEFELPAVML